MKKKAFIISLMLFLPFTVGVHGETTDFDELERGFGMMESGIWPLGEVDSGFVLMILLWGLTVGIPIWIVTRVSKS